MKFKVGEILLIGAELALLGFAVAKARALWRVFRRDYPRRGDFLGALRQANAEATGGQRVVEIVLFELAMLHYALFAWGPGPDEPGRTFTAHRKSGYGHLLAGLGLVAAMELVLVHWLLQTYWSPVAAWVLTGLSLYGCLFFLADWKACRLRPLRLTEDEFEVRIGIRWDLHLPFELIRACRPASRREATGSPGVLKAVVRGEGDLVIELKAPVEAIGAYGRRRRVEQVLLKVDDRAAFGAALASRLAAAGS